MNRNNEPDPSRGGTFIRDKAGNLIKHIPSTLPHGTPVAPSAPTAPPDPEEPAATVESRPARRRNTTEE